MNVLRRVFRPTNRRVRIIVGLFLAGLFWIQCTKTEAVREEPKHVRIVHGERVTKGSTEVADHVIKLAKAGEHVEALNYCLNHYKGRYQDYTCTLIKQERLRGELGKVQTVAVKFRDKPFSVAMKWVKNPPLGDRVLYIEGEYGGNMLVRPRGLIGKLVGTVMREPDGKDARKNSLRTVDKFGFERSLQSLLKYYEAGKVAGELGKAYGGEGEVAGRRAAVLVRYLTDDPKYPSYKTLAYIDLEYLVPICVEGFDSKDNLICRYVFTDIKFNVGLTDEDFTPQANDMKPPKKK